MMQSFFSDNHDHTLVYAKNKNNYKINGLPRTLEMNERYKNPDNDPNGPWMTQPLHAKSGNDKKFSFTFKNGVTWEPPRGTFPRHTKESLEKYDSENNYGELTDLYCKIIHKEENPILVKLRLHENNLQTRPLLKMEESEKLSVIEDYMSLLQQARKQNIEINGQKVKGKTRDLIAQRFNIAPSTAQILVEKIKNREKGTDFGTDKKTTLSDIEKIEKIISKLATQLDKLTASELEKIIQSKNMSEEKNKIFNVLFQSKMKL